ncbi:peptidase C1B, bleomycin hydrolase [Geopyxis carbonaria]|nr:peptidase C1B, bleomycin hydrolase [Geopyxis carbonaria]
MGSSLSKSSRTATYPAQKRLDSSSSKLGFEDKVSELTIEDCDVDCTAELNVATTIKWEDKLLGEPKNRLALGALTTAAATSVLVNPNAVLRDGHLFSHKIELEGAPVTNQRSSGRCWLFASTNVFRVGLMKKFKLGAFELSQSYLFFWDKLEKANFFLMQILDTMHEPLDGRLIQYLLNSPVGDGGQWDMVVNLVEKYGLVPQQIFPDSFNAKASGRINWLITAKLREAALQLRRISESGSEKDKSEALLRYKTKVMQEIYGVLVLSLGAPPKPEDTFTWNYNDKEGKFHSITSTPLEFYNDNIGAVSYVGTPKLGLPEKTSGVGNRFSLVNDPRNPYMRLLSVERLGNVHGGRGIQYVNVSMETMKNAIISMIKANVPVFFGCDVGKFSDSSKGIMDTDLFDYELGFNISLRMNKSERLQTGESSMTHAMVLSGVHIVDGVPQKWRVENSWGETSGEKGYFVMSNAWMDEYCYQAVVDPSFVDKEILDVLKQDPINLPVWDPMGSLA